MELWVSILVCNLCVGCAILGPYRCTKAEVSWFYVVTAIYIKRLSVVCPLLWILVTPKLRPMDSQIEWHMALHRPIREPQDVTSLWLARNHLFWLTMGLAPSTLQSHITALMLTQLQAYWAQTTAKRVPFIIILVRSFYIKSSQSRTLYLILTWCARATALNLSLVYWSVSSQ